MIFTIATAALQEVDKQLQAEKAKIAQLQGQMNDSTTAPLIFPAKKEV